MQSLEAGFVQLSSNGETGPTTLIDSVAEFVNHFVFLAKYELYVLVAAWIVATHLHQQFDYLGYLFAYSPERESGKTTLLKILNLIVDQPTGLQVSPTPATLFRTAQDHTQLLDEVDSWTNDADLKDILNAGYEKGGVVTRCDRTARGFKPTEFPVFAPRALAGIGLNKLHQTTLDRTFAIAMVRQMKGEKRERLRPCKVRSTASQLKKEIQKWVKANKEQVVAVYEQGDFQYLERFSDRTVDIAEPLAAIVEVMYSGHAELELTRALLVGAIATTRKEQQSASLDHRILLHLLQLSQDEDPLVGNASELAAQCGNFDEHPDQYTVSKILRRYEFENKSHRKSGEDKPRYRYFLERAKLQEVVDRWVPDDLETEAKSAVLGTE